MQLSPEDKKGVFGVDKLKTAYQRKKRSLSLSRRVKRVHITSMSKEKDDLKSIKVYKFNNTKEKWHEFVEKSVFSIWVDLLLCRSIQLLVLSYAEMFVYMYLSQLMSTFTNYLKVHHLLDGIFNP